MRYSVDFRRKVLSVREKEGLTIAQVAARFNIGVASVVRWLKQLEPKVHGFRHRKIDRDALKEVNTRQAIEYAGHTALFLPPCSPELNPIEKKQAQTKASRRKMTCDRDQLFQIESLLFG